jgi:hypothetical protein
MAWHVWLDNVPAEWAGEDVPRIFAREDGKTGWMPLVVCDGKEEADSVADGLEISEADLIKSHGLVVYRNPLSDLESLTHSALVMEKVNQLARLAADERAREEQADWPPLILASRAISLRAAVREVAKPEPSTPPTDNGAIDADEVSRLLYLAGDGTGVHVLAIARDQAKTVEERLHKLKDLDKRYEGFDSEKLADLLGVTGPAIRKTNFWRGRKARKESP